MSQQNDHCMCEAETKHKRCASYSCEECNQGLVDTDKKDSCFDEEALKKNLVLRQTCKNLCDVQEREYFEMSNKSEMFKEDPFQFIGLKAGKLIEKIFTRSSTEGKTERYQPSKLNRVQTRQLGLAVASLMLFASVMWFWAFIALTGNAGNMTQKWTFLAAMLLFPLSTVCPFAPIIALVIIYRTRGGREF